MAAYKCPTPDASGQKRVIPFAWQARSDRSAAESAFTRLHISAGNYEAFGIAAGVFLQ
jgi:hypothetical protein